jgi:hypothetical protein
MGMSFFTRVRDSIESVFSAEDKVLLAAGEAFIDYLKTNGGTVLWSAATAAATMPGTVESRAAAAGAVLAAAGVPVVDEALKVSLSVAKAQQQQLSSNAPQVASAS